MELSLLILVCIHKSFIVYLLYVVPIGHRFSFLVMEKSCKINVENRGHPATDNGELFSPISYIFTPFRGHQFSA